MHKEQTDHHEDHFILPRKRKVAYGIGGITYMLFNSGAAQISMIFNVVFKLDFQKQEAEKRGAKELDGFNLGVGYQF